MYVKYLEQCGGIQRLKMLVSIGIVMVIIMCLVQGRCGCIQSIQVLFRIEKRLQIMFCYNFIRLRNFLEFVKYFYIFVLFVFYSICEEEDKGYDFYFTMRNLGFREVQCWFGQDYIESYFVVTYDLSFLILDLRFFILRWKEQVLFYFQVWGGFRFFRGILIDRRLYSSCFFFLSLLMNFFFGVVWVNIIQCSFNLSRFARF